MTASLKEFAAARQGFSLISNRKLLSLYTTMFACRDMAEEAIPSNSEADIGSAETMLGHEAAVVGAAIDLLAGDLVAPELYPQAALAATNTSVQAAATLAAALNRAEDARASQSVVLLFSSARRLAQPSWQKALLRAAARRLPTLFVVLNPPQSAESLAKADALASTATGHTVPTFCVDGADVVAVYRVVCESITHARKGQGPTLIDCRLLIGDDPLRIMEKYLIGKGLAASAFPFSPDKVRK